MLDREDIYLWAHACLNGEITTEMRMVALRIDAPKKMTFCYYLDKEPTEFVRERAEIVALNFEAGLTENLDQLDIEFVHTAEPLGKLDVLDRQLFRRWENSEGTTEPNE